MYSIFHTHSKTPKYIAEGEPPLKKIVTEGDILIKKLVDNQLKTHTTLTEQLLQNKVFCSTGSFTDVTRDAKGKTELKDFQSIITNSSKDDELLTKGLNSRDIEIYKDYISLGSNFILKYKDINKEVLQQRLNQILTIIEDSNKNNCSESLERSVSRHHQEYVNSLKPQSIETKLFKFASENNSKTCRLLGPLDELPELENEFMNDIRNFSKCDLKKIRKKARSLGHKIDKLNEATTSTISKTKTSAVSRPTLWDVREKPPSSGEKVEIINKDKIYTCKQQNWYTIRDGKIVKIIDKMEKDCVTKKLTLENLKNNPRFVNYERGNPSQTLFLKNLAKSITKELLEQILKDHKVNYCSINLMNGKMKGQAFLHFQDETLAEEGLEILNGLMVDGRPIVVQFGNKK
ncbi:hypothetical protein ABEB36_004019 [Hypothenemus hampei]|uniref:RRM domain-containing protein n=1 Tax=Hypothenemus hampei TaxID=57062 RepID=A0ABD1F5P0_HYPHA